jgi:hypothetical protein
MATRTKTAAPPPAADQDASLIRPDTRIRAKSEIMWLRASTIGQDLRVNTRTIDAGWVSAKSNPDVFDWDFLGTVAVSMRGDGTRIAVDGQHRLALLDAIGVPDAEVKCEVFKDLTLAQEAALFIGLNASRTVRPVSLFLAKVTMGDQLSTDILRIVEDCSWTITPNPGRGVLNCVKALIRLHSTDITRNGMGGFEPRALRDTLTVLTNAWGQQDGVGNESLITGIGKIMVRDGDVVRDDVTSGVSGMDRLIGVLEQSGPDPSGLLVKARAFQGTRVPPVALPTAVAQVISASWNHGKQSRRLSPFVS